MASELVWWDTPRMRVLDLFCGEGGATRGYQLAGFDVTGVDVKRSCRKHYPGTFVHGDALEYAILHAAEYDLVHASPPCQAYSIATAGNPGVRARHQRLIGVVRDILVESGRPYVIENVAQARRELVDPVTLCGTAFGLTAIDDDGTPLEMWRHRLFESTLPLVGTPCLHGRYSTQVAGSYGGARRDKDEARLVRHGGYVPAKHVQEELLGIGWGMTVKGLHESIPPAYTHYLGTQAHGYLVEAMEAADA